MSAELLDKSRKLTRLFKTASKFDDYSEFVKVVSEVLVADIILVNSDGEIIDTTVEHCDKDYLEKIICFDNTRENLKDGLGSVWLAAPITVREVRLGTLCAIKSSEYFDIEDIVIAENAATLVGVEMLALRRASDSETDRKKATAKAAMRSLSMTEGQAVVAVFNELGGNDGLLVTSKIADKAGITRSVIINAMRKLESAGIVVCRSSGMKGTNIKVINEMIYNEVIVAKDI